MFEEAINIYKLKMTLTRNKVIKLVYFVSPRHKDKSQICFEAILVSAKEHDVGNVKKALAVSL